MDQWLARHACRVRQSCPSGAPAPGSACRKPRNARRLATYGVQAEWRQGRVACTEVHDIGRQKSTESTVARARWREHALSTPRRDMVGISKRYYDEPTSAPNKTARWATQSAFLFVRCPPTPSLACLPGCCDLPGTTGTGEMHAHASYFSRAESRKQDPELRARPVDAFWSRLSHSSGSPLLVCRDYPSFVRQLCQHTIISN